MTSTELLTARHLGLSLSSLQIILTLAEHGELTLGDLADRIAVSSAALTGTADTLIQKGLAARVHGISDRRTITLRLTGKGEQVHYQITGRECLLKI